MTARIDIPPGTVFDRLTVIEETRTPRGDRAMLCRCECGNMKVATAGALRCGDVKSCGCMRQGETIPPGTVFGRLTVIEEAPRRGARGLRAMLCRCECGTTKVVGLGNLRYGQVTSCGCARSDRALDVPPGTVFGYLTVIGEAPRVGPYNSRAMLCRCECGEQTTVPLSVLRSGNTKSCGCRGTADLAKLQPGEVPLHGKIARGRVALVDPEDYDLVMQHRWRVYEREPVAAGRRPQGPYAVSDIVLANGKQRTIRMHALIMGQLYIDHVNNNGLDNRRVNLRPATQTQNLGNQRTQQTPGKTSRYKGVHWNRRDRAWAAGITDHGTMWNLGRFASEEDAALAYDLAARKVFGEFAKLNFDYEPGTIADARLQAIRSAGSFWVKRTPSERMVERWRNLRPVTRTCVNCGREYESRSLRPSSCCGKACRAQWYRRRKRERQQEQQRDGQLF